MNKKIIAGAILGIASGAAFAQSSVTIYGVVDAGLTYAKDYKATGHSRVGLDSGLQSGSRIGFKGTEDLGNGTAALFQLEAGFGVDDGSTKNGTGLFTRRAVVGVSDTTLGTVLVGRKSSNIDDLASNFDAFGNGTNAAVGNVTKYDNRMNNGIYYTTSTFAGFSAQAEYAFGENTSTAYGSNNASDGRHYGLSLNYANGPFAASLAGAHSDYKGATDSVADASSLFGYSIAKRDQYALGASYDFAVVKPFALLSYAKNTQLTSANSLKDKSATVGVTAPFGASTVLASVGYVNVKENGSKANDATQYALGYTYNFSKRTNLYTAYTYVKADQSLKATATTLSGTQSFAVGIRHKF